MISLVRNLEEAKEMEFIFKVACAGFRSKQLGRDAYNRMKNGDFTNTPEIKRKIVKNITENRVKGYD